MKDTKTSQINGVLNIFKNKGMTSFDVVRKIKFLANEKKVGHTGTLDPEATGVLPVCLGKATKTIDYIMNSNKVYEVKFLLGVKTTTYDLEGEILEKNEIDHIKSDEVSEVALSFIGEYDQVPPMYSALKKNGVRLYELARKGIEVEREARKVRIFNISDLKIELPYVYMKVACSKGTYIRSLCYDIGEKLKVGAAMAELNRTETSIFKQSDSVNIDDLTKENIQDYIMTIEDALSFYPKITVKSTFTKLLINGVKVFDKRLTNEKREKNVLYRVYDSEGIFIGIGKQDDDGFKIEKLLL
ncbi:tRNA pseudouridine55 synthase [Clostridium beijerinckii]|jgi:tRNA pseudouridine synthase B (EC 4.2.1.70)|uniref:tRNA pseudouridine synthase B n=2 Tax=Clostridium beijerinckii TaxID=1520 RepID=A0AAE2RTY2_CLOBE|nr:tRNA pseudouridine(55) synthase TruB [Clostridium beijerinckii]ABR33387.1 tRNA pseudouridine synthase B [Clostridium beijerinckii NCIMB 8052]AIU00441.1 tRNA pseudouridine synthase B [Clostridium beijerinckii ATCC 35702]MBF7811715.1 tRNA pseudouridine(55) synthase TruB [Clostridium beijerinckii]NOW92790.1 tRNA pseudouridine55 synthase [Clostridium beijerinckii]NRT25359.1 tRNA pseudouridine55 synthase [Clostridium beijerinckii]